MSNKPVSLCLVHMGKTGLELVKAYPDALPANLEAEIVLKSMPLAAKSGDFLSTTAGSMTISGCIFAVPGKERQNIASLVAVYNSATYNDDKVRKVFSYTIAELTEKKMHDVETIASILPSLYKGLCEQKMKVQISSVITLQFDFSDEVKEEEDFEESFTSDMW